jgi:hypothetical protein
VVDDDWNRVRRVPDGESCRSAVNVPGMICAISRGLFLVRRAFGALLAVNGNNVFTPSVSNSVVQSRIIEIEHEFNLLDGAQ